MQTIKDQGNSVCMTINNCIVGIKMQRFISNILIRIVNVDHKKVGTETEPCGTPLVTVRQLDDRTLSCSHCLLLTAYTLLTTGRGSVVRVGRPITGRSIPTLAT